MKAGDRVAVYFFFDADGVVDDYNLYLLNDLKKSLDWLIVVVNGKLNAEGEKKLEGAADRLIKRPNVGFDSWAYKAGLEDIGWELMPQLGELIMLNHTNFGPVYPFSESFDIAEKHPEWDFWGLSMHHRSEVDPYKICEYGYLPEHIQSHFIVVRTRMLASKAFRDYWEQLPEIHNYAEAVAFHEAKFTKHFHDLGFAYGVTADLENHRDDIVYPLMSRPLEMVRDARCPVFKRKLFYFEYDYFLQNTAGECGRDLLRYLKEKTDYPLELLWQNLLRTAPMAELAECMQLLEILPGEDAEAVCPKGKHTLLALLLSGQDGIDLALRYAGNMPGGAEILCAVPDEKLRGVFLSAAEKALPGRKIACRAAEAEDIRRRRYLKVFAKELREADYVFFACDGYDEDFPLMTGLMSRAERGFDSVLGGSGYAGRVLRLFEENPRLGLLMVPQSNHSYFYTSFGNYWFDWNAVADTVLPELKLTRIPQSRRTEPLMPADGYFWARGTALRGYLDRYAEISEAMGKSTVGDEPREMGMLCMYALMAQDAGFYSSQLLSVNAARAEALNLSSYVRGFNRAMFPHATYHNYTLIRDRLAAVGSLDKPVAKRSYKDRKGRVAKPRQPLYDRIALGLMKKNPPLYRTLKKIATPLRWARQKWHGV